MELGRQLLQAAQWARESLARLSDRTDKAPIDTVDRMFEFVSTRSALITQKKLYGYLKERIGMNYPNMFEDPQFARSINIANAQIFAASLSDMTVYAVAHAVVPASQDGVVASGMAIACYRHGLDDNRAALSEAASVADWEGKFADRVKSTAWENVAAGGNPFTLSPKALVKWAPIADEHKKHDREIVENSIKFAWNEVLSDFRKRLDPAAVTAEWTGRRG